MSHSWRTVCQDADDGSGDLIVDLPPDLLAEMGWKTGDILNFDILPDGTVTLSKLGPEEVEGGL